MKTLKLFYCVCALFLLTRVNAQCYLFAGNDEVICCPGGAVTLSATANMTNCSCSGYSVAWTPTTGLSNPYSLTTTANPNTTTTYTVCATAYSGRFCNTVCCYTCDVITVYVNNSCCRLMKPGDVDAEVNYESEIMVYPNPATDKLTIEWKKNISGAEIFLFDVNGKKIWSIPMPDASNKLNIETALLPKGIYFMKVISGKEEILNKKLVLE